MYQSEVTNVEYTRLLEGTNSGMRKYVNNGLIELEAKLKERIAEHVEKELLTLVA